MKAIDAQGAVFVAAALATTAATVVLPPTDHNGELIVVALLVLLAGVPHGALDALLVRRLYRVDGSGAWSVFVVAYLLLAAAVVALWIVLPVVFLGAFLLASAFHFSGDPRPGTTPVARLLYAGAIIVLPFVLHATETNALFSALAGSTAARLISSMLGWLALPWLAAVCVAALHAAITRQWWSALELTALALLGALAPPLVAFAVFFCTMHGARHIMRSIAATPGHSFRSVSRAMAAPMAGVFALAAVGWVLLDGVTVDVRLVQLLFVGLAALTVPHMALVERLRFRRVRERLDG